jgi:hypothetical protein
MSDLSARDPLRERMRRVASKPAAARRTVRHKPATPPSSAKVVHTSVVPARRTIAAVAVRRGRWSVLREWAEWELREVPLRRLRWLRATITGS